MVALLLEEGSWLSLPVTSPICLSVKQTLGVRPHFLRENFSRKFWGWRGQKILGKKKRFLGRFLWEQNLVQNLDLTQDFPNKISFHFFWVNMLPKNLPKIFRWPEMCPLDKILAQDFQMTAFTKISHQLCRFSPRNL